MEEFNCSRCGKIGTKEDVDWFKSDKTGEIVCQDCFNFIKNNSKRKDSSNNIEKSESLLINSSRPYSSIITSAIPRDSFTIRLNNQEGALPPCKGRLATPVLPIIKSNESLF